MKTDGQRRSDNFEDRGAGRSSGGGRGGRGGGGGGGRLLFMLAQRFGFSGVVVAALALGGVYFLAPQPIKQLVFGALFGVAPQQTTTSSGSGQVCTSSADNAAACDFSRVVLASTEDVWSAKFAQGSLPRYGTAAPGAYAEPTLVVFTGGVSTGGCGNASSSSGPFYCPADQKLYIDPGFYTVMEQQLRAPGDFAQAYVIAHEVGHHVQNLIGAMGVGVRGESEAQVSVRVELQADCLAGVWGHTAQADLAISAEDLGEALQAAHAIGDDALGHRDKSQFTHGSSAQRTRWFRRGFDSGDAQQCDTFSVEAAQL
ncbi:MAG: putative metalloprotease [Myxococcota bacterium]|jgi:predicted metalloprotease